MEGLQQAVLAQLSLESLLLRRAEGREGLLDFLAPVGPRTGLRLVVKPFPSWLAIQCEVRAPKRRRDDAMGGLLLSLHMNYKLPRGLLNLVGEKGEPQDGTAPQLSSSI